MQPLSTNSPLIQRARQEAVFFAPSLLERSLAMAVDALAEAERHASSVPLRRQLWDAQLGLEHRHALCTDFAARLDEAITQALDRTGIEPVEWAPVEFDELSLSLVDDSEVARFVEASRLQQAVMPVVEHSLTRLDSLISSAMGLPVVRPEFNPLAPQVICGVLLDVLEAQPQPPAVRTHWVRHVAQPFAHELDQLYVRVAEQLEAQGVEEARYRLRLAEGGPMLTDPGAGMGKSIGTDTGAGPAGPPQDVELASEVEMVRRRRALMTDITDLAQARPQASRAVMRDFLYRPQWLAEHDEALPHSYYEAVQQQTALMSEEPPLVYDAAAAARTRARALALNVVDRPARAVSTDVALSPDDWGDAGSPQARTRTLMDLKAQASKVSQVLGLDAVRTLVEQVADDPRVLAPVREAFVALEPALLRMAMADPRFFGDDHHPARRLVEEVAQRSFKYNDEYAEDFQQFMAPVRQAVRELNARPEAHTEDFAGQLKSFDQEWQIQDEQDKAEHEQGLRSIQFAQQRQALADKIAWEFSLRSDLDGVPAVVVDFLFQDWSLVISHAQLTAERSQLDPGGYLAVVTDLLWSVRRDAALKAPARLFDVVPGIVQTLRRGLQMLGKEPEETENFFNTLMRLHAPVLRLRRMRSARDAEVSGFARLGDETELISLEAASLPEERPRPRAAAQPWLGRQERAAAGFDDVGRDDLSTDTLLADMATARADAPVVDEDQANERAVRETPSAPHSSPVADNSALEPSSATPDELRARTQLATLRTGDWVDLQVRGHWHRARLQWCSDNGALFMFISHGGRPHSMTRRTCEKLLRQRNLRPVEGGKVVDKALSGLAKKALETQRAALA